VFLVSMSTRTPKRPQSKMRIHSPAPNWRSRRREGASIAVEICVVALPKRNPWGAFAFKEATVLGRSSRPGRDRDQGDLQPSLARWVEQCVRGPESRDRKVKRNCKNRASKTPRQGRFDRTRRRRKAGRAKCAPQRNALGLPPIAPSALIWDWNSRGKLDRLQRRLIVAARKSPSPNRSTQNWSCSSGPSSTSAATSRRAEEETTSPVR